MNIKSKLTCLHVLCLLFYLLPYSTTYASEKTNKYAILGKGKSAKKVLWSSFSVYQKGVKAYQGNNITKAKEYFEKAISLDSSYLEPQFYLGNIYLTQKKTEKAKSYFVKAYKIDRNNAKVLYSLALCYFYQRNNKNALDHLKKAQKLNPLNTKIKELINTIHKSEVTYEAKTLLDEGKYKEALGRLNKAIPQYPKASLLYHIRGQTLIRLEDYSSAILDLEKALTSNYHTASLYFDIGYVYFNQGRYTDATKNFKKAAKLDSSMNEAFFYLGTIYLNRSNFGDAVTYFEKALAIEPENPKTLYSIGTSYSSLGNNKKALTYLEKAYKIDQSDPEIKEMLERVKRDSDPNIHDGISFMEKKKYKEASNSFSKAIKHFPKFGKLYHLRGQARIHMGFYSAALEDLKKSRSMDYYNSSLLSDIGYVHYQLREYAKAVKNFDKALKMNPNNKQALEFLSEISDGSNLFRNGVMHFNENNYEQAIESFSQAILNSPRDFNSYNFRGLAYVRIGSLEEALEDFSKAIELDQNNPKVLFNIGYAYYKMLDYPKALDYFQKSKILSPKDIEVEKFLKRVQKRLIEQGLL